MGFSRPEYWSGLPCPPPGDLPDPRIEPTSLMSPALAGESFTTNATWQALSVLHVLISCYKFLLAFHPTQSKIQNFHKVWYPAWVGTWHCSPSYHTAPPYSLNIVGALLPQSLGTCYSAFLKFSFPQLNSLTSCRSDFPYLPPYIMCTWTPNLLPAGLPPCFIYL